MPLAKIIIIRIIITIRPPGIGSISIIFCTEFEHETLDVIRSSRSKSHCHVTPLNFQYFNCIHYPIALKIDMVVHYLSPNAAEF